MSRSNRVVPWAIAGTLLALGAAGVAFPLLNATVVAPRCGDQAKANMQAAIGEVNSFIQAASFEIVDDCDSGGEVYAGWEITDLDRMLARARQSGCRVGRGGYSDDPFELMTCDTATMKVVFFIDPGGDEAQPVTGSMQRVR